MNADLITCDWCHRDFPVDVRCFVEMGLEAVQEIPEGDEWKHEGEEFETLPLSELGLPEAALKSIQAHTGLTDAEMHQLMTKGEVEGLGSIMCLDCQKAFSQEDGEEEE